MTESAKPSPPRKPPAVTYPNREHKISVVTGKIDFSSDGKASKAGPKQSNEGP